MKVTELALRFKTSVYVLVVFVVIAGTAAYRSLPLEAAPEVKIPMLLVHTIYPGVAPADVEQLVTNVMERELKDLKDVKKMSSTSAESVSLITVEFETGVDLDNAYQKMRDQVDKAKAKLPDDAEEPVLIEINVSEFPMMLVNVSGTYDQARLKAVAEGLEEKIEQVKGVLGVDLVGGMDREVQVYLDPRKLEHHNVDVNQVIRRIQQEHLTTPAGNLRLGKSKYSVRIPGEYRDVRRMAQIVVKAPDGDPVRLSDIGRVVDGYKERQTISRINGTACVTLRVKKRAGENIVRISDEVRALLAAELPRLPAGTSTTVRQDNSEFVKDVVGDLENSIITGLILVLAVLLFAMGARNATLVAISIPLSMLISFITLQALGITLNMVVLFSLILALGMLVDNSIVVVENIYRHASEGKGRVQAALAATREVAWPIIASTGTTVAVFLPLLFWPGIMGEFMSYLPLTVIVVLASSLFVALVINPVVAASFLRPGKETLVDEEGRARGPVMRAYTRVLGWSLAHPKILLTLTVAALFGAGALYGVRGTGVELFPNLTPERAQVIIKAPQGTDLSQTDALMGRVEQAARSAKNTEDVVANVGFAGGFNNIGGASNTHEAVADLEFRDRHHRVRSTWDTVRELREQLARLPGAEYRVEVEKGGPPTGAPVSVEISGDDFAVLQRQARAHNPSYKLLGERVRQANLLIHRAWSSVLPRVSANAAVTRNSDEVELTMPLGAGPPQTVTLLEGVNKRFGVTASATLFNASAIPLIKNAYDNLEATRLRSVHQRAELELAVARAFYQVRATRQLVRTARDNLTTARRFQQEADARRKLGSATSIDAMRARLRVLAATKALRDAEDGVKLAHAGLATLMGVERDAFTLADPPATASPGDDLTALTRRALRERQDLRALRLDRVVASRGPTAAFLGWAPVLDVTYSWRYDSAGGFSGSNSTWQLVFGARWSLLEGGQRVTAVRQQRSQLRAAHSTLRARVLVVRQQTRQGRLRLRKAERNLELAGQQAALAQKTYDAVSRQYRAGLVSSLEVVNAGTELERRRVARVVERLQRDLARLELRRAVGGRVDTAKARVL